MFVEVAIAIPLHVPKQDTLVDVILAAIAGGLTNAILDVNTQPWPSVTVNP